MTAMAHSADAWRAGTRRLGRDGPVPGTGAEVAADRPAAVPARARTVRSWPLLVLAAPAAAEVWSGWVGIAQKTGFGLVSPLPGIWPSLHLDTTITLPVGVEAYAAYALRAWLAREDWISDRSRRFAKWSAICSFALGMAGQVAYHLLAQAGAARAPWPITTLVSCLPVLVLAMGTALAHMLRVRHPAIKKIAPAEVRGSSRARRDLRRRLQVARLAALRSRGPTWASCRDRRPRRRTARSALLQLALAPPDLATARPTSRAVSPRSAGRGPRAGRRTHALCTRPRRRRADRRRAHCR